MSIQDFKSTIQQENNLSKSNRFELSISKSGLNVSFLCESCSLPGRQINTNEFFTWNKQQKNVYGYMNDDVTLTFHLTNAYSLKRYIEDWINEIIDINRYRAGYYDDYVRDITISQLDHKDKPIYTVVLFDAHPITMNSIELSNASDNATNKITTVFYYRNYREERITQ
jgi:hypothetical protein